MRSWLPGPVKNLKLIVALQAGVDSLLKDPELPAAIPL